MRTRLWRPRAAAMLLAVAAVVAGAGFVLPQRDAEAAPDDAEVLVTLVARSCPQYSDIMANKARNNVQESLRDLGEDSNYRPNETVSAAKEAAGTPLPPCEPLPGWTFSTGKGFRGKSPDTLNLSTVSGVMRQNLTTTEATPELDPYGEPTGRSIEGAVTVALTPEEITRSSSGGLIVQGGTPSQPLNGKQEQYGFGALRCAQDSVNGDNVEYVSFPAGTRHVFCYYYAVTPPPDSATITVAKEVADGTNGQGTFRFDGNISYADGNGDGEGDFNLTAATGKPGSMSFVRAAGDEPWTFAEAAQDGWNPPEAPRCVSRDGNSQMEVNSAGGASVILGAGDQVTCTYTNSRSTGDALLEKESINGTGTFDIDLATPPGSPPAAVQPVTTQTEGVPVTVAEAPDGAQPGTYTVTEKVPAPTPEGTWELTGAYCDGESSPITKNPPTDAAPDGTWTVSHDIAAAENTRCLLSNRFLPGGEIGVEKVTQGGTGAFTYTVRPSYAVNPRTAAEAVHTGTATTTSTDDPTPAKRADGEPGAVAQGLLVGPDRRYTVQEMLPPPTADGHWEVAAIDCQGTEVRVNLNTGSAQVALRADNPKPVCRFTNVFKPAATLDVTKETTGDTGLRPDPARVRLECVDGTADDLEVAPGETAADLPRHSFNADTTCTVTETADGAGPGIDVDTRATISRDGDTEPLRLGQPFVIRDGETVKVVIVNDVTGPGPSPSTTASQTPGGSPSPTTSHSVSHSPGTGHPSHTGASSSDSGGGSLALTGSMLPVTVLAALASLAIIVGFTLRAAARDRDRE